MRKLYWILVFLIAFFYPAFLLGATTFPYNIQGINDKNILANVNARLKSEQEKFISNIFYQKAPEIIRAAIAPYGYFDPNIRTLFSLDKGRRIPTYVISLGAPVRIHSIDIKITGQGKDNQALQKYIDRLPLKPGDIFNTDTYNQIKESLFEIANNEGYIHAALTDARVLIDTKRLTANITLHLETQIQYFFGPLHFNKNFYDPDFLERFNPFKPSDPFSSKKLLQLQQNMNDSRYFKQALIIPEFDKERNNHIPVQAAIVPPTARRYTLGIGYGTFTGPRLTAGMDFRRITDTGQSFDAQLKLSSVLSGLAARYYIPGRNPLTEQWTIGSNFQKFEPKSGQSVARTVYFGYTKKIDHWSLSSNINYLYERYQVQNNPSQDSQLLYPDFNLAYVKADNLARPTYGKSLNMEIKGASENVLSGTSFLQGEVRGKYFFSPYDKAHVILRGNLGYTVVHNLEDLPLSMRFFAGGITTIRGFPDSSIGPGRYLQVGSAEYRHHVTENWAAALFYDIGNATNHFDTPYNRGAGVGIIYESMIGPVRLYVARAISKPDQPYQIEFSLGPEF